MATVTGSKRLLDLEVTSVEANTVVASGTVTALGGNSSNWNTAYGWGNHASAGYLTGNQTITLTGDVSGSGTTSISVTVADDSHNHTFITGGSTSNLNSSFTQRTPDRGLYSDRFSSSATNKPLTYDNANAVLNWYSHGSGGTGSYGKQLVTVNNGGVYLRNVSNGSFGSWNRFFADDYHPNADKWTTARTLSLTGAVTGSASFDGSGNISLATTATADPTLTLAGDASGSATFTNLGNATLTVTVADDSHNHVISNVDGLQAALDGKEASFTKNTAFNKNFGTTAGTVAQGNDSRINNGQTAYGWGDHGSAGYLTGNQTITLTGDVSGSGTTSISVTVADDSHNHVISNVDGLQTALDAKAPTASPTFTGTANIPAVNFSGASSLAVGSYVFAYEVGAAVSVRDIGDTVAGSNLMPTMVSINNPSASAANVNGDVVVFPGTDDSSTLSGTWMLMGGYADNYLLNDYPSTLWLRIS